MNDEVSVTTTVLFWALTTILPTTILSSLLVWVIILLRRIDKRSRL